MYIYDRKWGTVGTFDKDNKLQTELRLNIIRLCTEDHRPQLYSPIDSLGLPVVLDILAPLRDEYEGVVRAVAGEISD